MKEQPIASARVVGVDKRDQVGEALVIQATLRNRTGLLEVVFEDNKIFIKPITQTLEYVAPTETGTERSQDQIEEDNSYAQLRAAMRIILAEDRGSIEDVEKVLLQEVMALTEGNKALAAKKIGVTVRSLYRRLDKVGIK
jgi:DNA-binding NtrC family response regulator